MQLLQPEAQLTVITADAMTITELPGEPTTLVANLPYNVSVPVLLHLLEHFPAITSGLVMVQSEVGQRLAATPGLEDLRQPQREGGLVRALRAPPGRSAGRCSGRCRTWTRFWCRSRCARAPLGDESERLATFALVDAAFGQRRKMLRQSLAGVLGGSQAASARPAQRPASTRPQRGEQLTVARLPRHRARGEPWRGSRLGNSVRVGWSL